MTQVCSQEGMGSGISWRMLYYYTLLKMTWTHICNVYKICLRVCCLSLSTVSTFRSIKWSWSGDSFGTCDGHVAMLLGSWVTCQRRSKSFAFANLLWSWKKSDRKHLQNNAKTFRNRNSNTVSKTCFYHPCMSRSTAAVTVLSSSSDVNNLKALDGSTTNVARLCHVHKAGCTCIGVDGVGCAWNNLCHRRLVETCWN